MLIKWYYVDSDGLFPENFSSNFMHCYLETETCFDIINPGFIQLFQSKVLAFSKAPKPKTSI